MAHATQNPDVMAEKLLAKFPVGPEPPLNTHSTFPYDLMEPLWSITLGQSGTVPAIGTKRWDLVIVFFLAILGFTEQTNPPIADSVHGRWIQFWDEVDLGAPIEAD